MINFVILGHLFTFFQMYGTLYIAKKLLFCDYVLS